MSTAAAGAGAGAGSESERNARTREVQNAFMFLNRVTGTKSTEGLASIVNEMFSYLLTTNHILLNDKFFNTIVNLINEIVEEKSEVYTLVKDSLSALCVKLRSIHPDVEIRGCTERAIHEPAAPLPITYKKLGSGGFGAVISPALPNTKNGATVNFPGNVTKIFFKRRDKEKLLEKLPTVQRVMGSYPEHRVNNYSRSYKFQNLPLNAQRILRNASKHQILPTNNIHVVHMPNLGVDLSYTSIQKHYKQLRKIPIVKIVEEIVKLISQTMHLDESGYIHGDIRDTNIMIDPESGTMTLIDFDWVKSYDEFIDSYPFGFYSNPPEYLLYNFFYTHTYLFNNTNNAHENANTNEIQFNENINQELIEDNINNLHEYVTQNCNRFLFWKYGMELKNESAFRTYLLDTLVNNADILRQDIIEDDEDDYDEAIKHVFKDNLNTFDNYGLSITLLSLFVYIYPYAVSVNDISSEESPEIKEHIKESLRSRISKHGVPYSDAELDAIVLALRKLSYLLYLMGNVDMSIRPPPAHALLDARAILNELVTNLASANARETDAELRRMAVLAGNLSALPTMNGGRRTRHRVLKRSKKTRRCRSRPTK